MSILPTINLSNTNKKGTYKHTLSTLACISGEDLLEMCKSFNRVLFEFPLYNMYQFVTIFTLKKKVV